MKARYIILAVAAGLACVLTATRELRPGPGSGGTAVPNQPEGAASMPSPMYTHESTHATEDGVEEINDSAAIRVLYAILHGDAEGISRSRSLLADAPEALSHLARFLNCGIRDVEVETMRLLIQTRNGKALAMVVGRMLTLDIGSPEAARFKEVFSECRDYAVAEWLVDCLGSGNQVLSRRAAVLLSILHGPETAVAIALPRAMHELTAVQVDLLASREDVSEVEALIAVFRETPHTEMRAAAAFSLATIGSPAAVKFLVQESLTPGDSGSAALAAINTVTSSYGQQALLASALNEDLPEPTRTAAVSALHSMGSEHIFTQLSNVDISPSEKQLNEAVNTAIASHEHSPRTKTNPDILNGKYEICF